MKPAFVLLVFLLGCTASLASPPRSSGEFSSALRRAYDACDPVQVRALTWIKDVPEFDVREYEGQLQMLFKNFTQVESIAFEPVPAAMRQPLVTSRMRSDFSYQPAGIAVVKYRVGGTVNPAPARVPYAIIDGGYYIVIRKITKLENNGPPDKKFDVVVLGRGMSQTKIHIKYTVAGVEQECNNSAGFPAQFINEVTVTSNDNNVDVKLTITEDSKLIFSKALKGRGKIIYKGSSRTKQESILQNAR